MVILGLGSNVGDRLAYLRHALRLLKKIPEVSLKQVSPVYVSDALLPDDAPIAWDTPYLNLAIHIETTLEPHHLLRLTKEIEFTIGRSGKAHWGPRPIDIDILIWDDLILYDDKLHIPHAQMHQRPFVMWPVADLAPRWVYPLPGDAQGKTAAEIVAKWGSRFSDQAPLHTKQILQRIDTTQWIGIINVTPDSFSDGGNFNDATAAIQHAHNLVECGAEIIDVGAEASGPSAVVLDAATEWLRLEPILTGILAESSRMLIPPKISIDTRYAETAKKALALGVDWINDISGLSDPAMREIIADSTCDVIIMHQLGIPAKTSNTLSYHQDPIAVVYEWMEKQLTILEKSGIKRERIIADVGIGFGKTAEQSLELIQQIKQFNSLGTRLLIGHSRKSFLKLFTQQSPAARDIETLAMSLFLAKQNIDYARVHNVEMCARAIKVSKALNE